MVTTEAQSSIPEQPTRLPRVASSLTPEQRAQKQREAREATWNRLAVRIGRRYADCSLDNFLATTDAQRQVLTDVRGYASELIANGRAGRNVVLFGECGTGKDHLLTALMRVAIIGHGIRVEWKNGADLASEFREALHFPGGERCLVDDLATVPVLALSDPIGVASATDFQLSSLFRVVDARYRNQLPTWCTLNAIDGSQAEDRLTVPIVDRLRHGALALSCGWASYRTTDGR